MNPALQTERLLLRISTVDDVDLFRFTWGDAEVMQTFGPGVPVLPEYIKRHLDEHIEAYQSGKMFLFVRTNKRHIGASATLKQLSITFRQCLTTSCTE